MMSHAGPRKRPFGRSLEDFENLSEAEKKLIACAARGEVCKLGEAVPKDPTLDNIIRPELIRFLALGGDDTAPVHEKGVQLRGAWIGAAALDEGQPALDLEGAQLMTGLWFFNCYFTSTLKFGDMRASSLSLEGSFFPGIIADGLKLNGSLFLRGVHSKGTVRLGIAEINGDLDCSGGRFENRGSWSLFCDRARIAGNVFFVDGFRSIGETRLLDVMISGSFTCSGGRFDNEDGRSLSCDGITVGGSVFCDKAFYATGEVRLHGGVIRGYLDCDGGIFENKSGIALSCDGAKISGYVFCRNGFHATGTVLFTTASIGGDLDCSVACFANKGGMALVCDGASIGRKLYFRDVSQIEGYVSLAHATVSTLADDINCWPNESLVLDGFRYERIAASSPLDSKRRIAWLEKQRPELLTGNNFALQPWMHLAKVLREQGHFREAAEVDIAREERLRAAGKFGERWALLSWSRKCGQLDEQGNYVSFVSSLDEQIKYFLHSLYGWFSGYGHRPLRIIYFAATIWVGFALVYSSEAINGHFVPLNPSLAKTGFNPWAYSLDLILPVVQLGEFAKWIHVSDGSWLTLSGWTGFLIYFEKIFGWIAALTLAAIATGLVKRKDG